MTSPPAESQTGGPAPSPDLNQSRPSSAVFEAESSAGWRPQSASNTALEVGEGRHEGPGTMYIDAAAGYRGERRPSGAFPDDRPWSASSRQEVMLPPPPRFRVSTAEVEMNWSPIERGAGQRPRSGGAAEVRLPPLSAMVGSPSSDSFLEHRPSMETTGQLPPSPQRDASIGRREGRVRGYSIGERAFPALTIGSPPESLRDDRDSDFPMDISGSVLGSSANRGMAPSLPPLSTITSGLPDASFGPVKLPQLSHRGLPGLDTRWSPQTRAPSPAVNDRMQGRSHANSVSSTSTASSHFSPGHFSVSPSSASPISSKASLNSQTLSVNTLSVAGPARRRYTGPSATSAPYPRPSSPGFGRSMRGRGWTISSYAPHQDATPTDGTAEKGKEREGAGGAPEDFSQLYDQYANIRAVNQQNGIHAPHNAPMPSPDIMHTADTSRLLPYIRDELHHLSTYRPDDAAQIAADMNAMLGLEDRGPRDRMEATSPHMDYGPGWGKNEHSRRQSEGLLAAPTEYARFPTQSGLPTYQRAPSHSAPPLALPPAAYIPQPGFPSPAGPRGSSYVRNAGSTGTLQGRPAYGVGTADAGFASSVSGSPEQVSPIEAPISGAAFPVDEQHQQQLELLGRRRVTGKGAKRVRKRQNEHHQQCLGCQVTETPEWRKGPMGPRTLCNACGLLYAKMCRKKEQDTAAALRATGNEASNADMGLREPTDMERQASLEALRAELGTTTNNRSRTASGARSRRVSNPLLSGDVVGVPSSSSEEERERLMYENQPAEGQQSSHLPHPFYPQQLPQPESQHYMPHHR